jgi:hypothetical protein
MNLFRSEEHAKNWSLYDPVSADAIMPLADWALAFSGPLMRNRLDPNYLAQVQEYTSKLFLALHKLGKTGPFWQSG